MTEREKWEYLAVAVLIDGNVRDLDNRIYKTPRSSQDHKILEISENLNKARGFINAAIFGIEKLETEKED